jgi:hypothetical protein
MLEMVHCEIYSISLLSSPVFTVGIAIKLQVRRPGRRGSILGRGTRLFSTMSRPAVVPTQPPTQCVPGLVSPEIKRQGREADHSSPSSVTHPYVFLAWCLIKTKIPNSMVESIPRI